MGKNQRCLSAFLALLLPISLVACATLDQAGQHGLAVQGAELEKQKPSGETVNTWTSSLGLPCERIRQDEGLVVACASDGGWLVFRDLTQLR